MTVICWTILDDQIEQYLKNFLKMVQKYPAQSTIALYGNILCGALVIYSHLIDMLDDREIDKTIYNLAKNALSYWWKRIIK